MLAHIEKSVILSIELARTQEESLFSQLSPDSDVSPAVRLGKRILAAGTIYGLTNFGLKGMNFIILPFLSRYLAPADFGVVALAETVAGPIGMICGLGAATTLRRMYYDFGNDERTRHAYVGSALRFVTISAVAVITLSCIIGPTLLKQQNKAFAVPFFPFLGVAVCAAGLGQIEQTQLSLFQVQNRPKLFALISAATFTLGTVSVVALVFRYHFGAIGVLTSRLIAVACGVLATTYLTRWFVCAPWHWRALGEQLRLGLPITLFEVVNLGLIFADRLILQHYRPLGDVGIYSLAYTFGSLMLTLSVSLSQVWSPLFFESACAGESEALRKISSSLMASLTAIACVGAIIATPVIHVLLDQRYAAACRLVPIVLGAYLVNSFYYLFELQAMQQKRTTMIAFVTIIACAVNIGLNLWMVPMWGMFGAAVSTLAAYVGQAAIMYLFVRKVARELYSSKLIMANLAPFAMVLLLVEIPLSVTAAAYVFPAALLIAAAFLWPLGLNRVGRACRAAFA